MKASKTRGKKGGPKGKKAEPPAKMGIESKARASQHSMTPKGVLENKGEVKPKATATVSGIGAAEALSFLKETKGQVTWTAKEMASTLRIGDKQAEQALPVLQVQGYVRPAPRGEWLTTPEGEAVAGAKNPRYTRASVERAIAALKERMKEMNRDAAAEYKVTQAVAFGDFLSERPQVQAADVGVQLERRRSGHPGSTRESAPVESAVEQAAQKNVLQKLRARTALLNLHPYEEWMSRRSHREIL